MKKRINSRFFIFFLFLFYLLAAQYSYSISSISVSFERLEMESGMVDEKSPQLTNYQATLSKRNSGFLKGLKLEQFITDIDISEKSIQIKLDLKQLHLPPPYNKMTNIKISCAALNIDHNLMKCEQGHIQFMGLFEPDNNNISFSFTYNLTESELTFNIENIKVGEGSIAFRAQINQQSWQSSIKVSQVEFRQLKSYFEYYLVNNKYQDLITNTQARLSGSVQANGSVGSQENNNTPWLQSAKLIAKLDKTQYQFGDDMAENLSLRLQLDVKQSAHQLMPSNNYQLALKLDNIKGEILHKELYVVPTGNEKINTQLTYNAKHKAVKFSRFNLVSANIFDFMVKGDISIKDTLAIRDLDAQLEFFDLKKFNHSYLKNILTDTAYEGLTLQGIAKTIINKKNNIIKLESQFKDFTSRFNKQFSVKDLNASLYWNNANQTTLPVPHSKLSWQKLSVNQLPLGKVNLGFMTHHDFLKLNKEVDIPIFDGALHINSLRINQLLAQLPDEYKLAVEKNSTSELSNGFTLTVDGYIKPVSLELLSQHYHWPVLNGSLSAVIPSTTYNEKFLKVGGAMLLRVFDGAIIIKDLKILEPLKDYAQLTANIDLNNLKLQELTKTYNFGEIHGRVEGKLSKLKLSAWRPVSFDAYIRTPLNDNSTHKISQRAIDNLSSLGGASGLLSRSFLRFFETFRYDKIGLSCKLKNNVCYMSGVEEKGDSYYIVKGGGIPRIDVMGFQKKVNWQVLTSRLQAIQQANEAVVE